MHIVNTGNGAALISNVCTHKNIILRTGSGNNSVISCPLHKWTFNNNSGKLIGTPNMDLCKDHDFSVIDLKTWNVILLHTTDEKHLSLMNSQLSKYVPDLTKYHCGRTIVDNINCNWKVFVEIYLDLYHIPFIHKGLGSICDGKPEIEMQEFWSVQKQMVHRSINHTGTTYGRYLDLLSKCKIVEDYEIKWVLIYPNIMIEKYPGNVVVVSTAWHIDPDTCLNIIEFYYDPKIIALIPDLPRVYEEAYLETASEDKIMLESMQIGTKAIYKASNNLDKNIHHPVLEIGVEEFYKYLASLL